MKNIVIYLFFIATIVIVYGFTYSIMPDDPDGKQIFVDKKCTTCHTVETAGVTSKKKDASDLSTSGDNLDSEFLKKYLNKKEKIDGKEHKTAFKGSEQELDVLVAWLESLKTKK